jgi:hypothetical protein
MIVFSSQFELELRTGRFVRFIQTNPDAQEANGQGLALEPFAEQEPEALEGKGQIRPFYRRSGEVGKPDLHHYPAHFALAVVPGQVLHQVFEQFR